MSIKYRSQFIAYLDKLQVAAHIGDCVEWVEGDGKGKDFRVYVGSNRMLMKNDGERSYSNVHATESGAYREFLAEVSLKKLADKI